MSADLEIEGIVADTCGYVEIPGGYREEPAAITPRCFQGVRHGDIKTSGQQQDSTAKKTPLRVLRCRNPIPKRACLFPSSTPCKSMPLYACNRCHRMKIPSCTTAGLDLPLLFIIVFTALYHTSAPPLSRLCMSNTFRIPCLAASKPYESPKHRLVGFRTRQRRERTLETMVTYGLHVTAVEDACASIGYHLSVIR